jgi:hypothetical protein
MDFVRLNDWLSNGFLPAGFSVNQKKIFFFCSQFAPREMKNPDLIGVIFILEQVMGLFHKPFCHITFFPTGKRTYLR